jgi:hypothetical protein
MKDSVEVCVDETSLTPTVLIALWVQSVHSMGSGPGMSTAEVGCGRLSRKDCPAAFQWLPVSSSLVPPALRSGMPPGRPLPVQAKVCLLGQIAFCLPPALGT